MKDSVYSIADSRESFNPANEAKKYDPLSKESGGGGRSWFNRTFRSMGPDSQRGGILTLLMAGIGVGLLALPKAFSFYGYVLGTAVSMYTAFCSYMAYYLVAELVALYPEHTLYSQMIEHFLGRRWGKITGSLFIMDYLGGCIGYLIIINKFLSDVLGVRLAMHMSLPFDDTFKQYLGLVIIIAISMLIAVGTLMKSASSLRYFGFVSIAMIIYLIGVSIWETGAYKQELQPTYQAYGTGKVRDYLENFGAFFFAFTTIIVFHQVYTSMRLPTVRRIKKIAFRVNFFLWAIYFGFIAIGYYSLGVYMQAAAFEIYPDKPHLRSDPNDVYMKILKLIYSLCLIPAILSGTIPLRDQLLEELNLQPNYKNKSLIAVSAAAIIGFFTWAFPKVMTWLNILGAVGGTSYMVILPSLCYYYGYRADPRYRLKIALISAWAIITSVIAFGTVAATVFSLIEAK